METRAIIHPVTSRPTRRRSSDSDSTSDDSVDRREIIDQELYPRELLEDVSDRPILDAGAHYGVFAIYLRTVVGLNNTLIASEAIQENVTRLRANTRDLDVLVDDRAISTSSGALVLRKPLLERTTHWSASRYDDTFGVERRTVPCVRFADLLKRSWSIVKLDLEGHEAEVILSTPHELLESIEVIVLETHTSDARDDREVLTRLHEAGFRQLLAPARRHRVLRRN